MLLLKQNLSHGDRLVEDLTPLRLNLGLCLPNQFPHGSLVLLLEGMLLEELSWCLVPWCLLFLLFLLLYGFKDVLILELLLPKVLDFLSLPLELLLDLQLMFQVFVVDWIVLGNFK